MGSFCRLDVDLSSSLRVLELFPNQETAKNGLLKAPNFCVYSLFSERLENKLAVGQITIFGNGHRIRTPRGRFTYEGFFPGRIWRTHHSDQLPARLPGENSKRRSEDGTSHRARRKSIKRRAPPAQNRFFSFEVSRPKPESQLGSKQWIRAESRA